MKPGDQLMLVLGALRDGPAISSEVATRLGWITKKASNILTSATLRGYCERVPVAGQVYKSFAITPTGLQRYAVLAAEPVTVTPEHLIKLISASPHGLTAFDLAMRSGVAPSAVDAALALHVTMSQIDAKAVITSLGGDTLYTFDAGSSRHQEWLRQGGAVRQHVTVEDDGAGDDSGDEGSVAAADRDDAPASTPAPEPAAPQALPVFECDIDAVHRKREAPLQVDISDEPEFLAAVYSDGRLWISSHGFEVTLPLAHTRRLMHYLGHTVGSAAGVDDVAGAVS